MKSVRLQLLVTATAVVIAALIFIIKGPLPSETIWEATQGENCRQVERNLKWGQHINAVGWWWHAPPLHYADTARMADFLLAHGADLEAPDQYGRCALDGAVDNGSTEVAAFLLSRGADPNAQDDVGGTPFLSAVEAGNEEVIRLFVSKGADVNAKDRFGRTPLLRAVGIRMIRPAVAELLISLGADINSQGCDGSPLQEAAGAGRADMVKLLMAHGADVKAQSNTGWTALHSASLNNRVEAAQVLIDAGADLNAADKFGNTPLHKAADCGCAEVAALLVSRRASINAKDSGGQTPLAIATLERREHPGNLNEKGRKEVAELLLEHGGKK